MSLVLVKIISSPRSGLKICPAVSKKIFPRAVVRNRIKRLIREAARPFLTRLRPGQAFLIIARPEIINQPLSRIKDEISSS